MTAPDRVINFSPLPTKKGLRGVRRPHFGVNSGGAERGLLLSPEGGDEHFLEVVVVLVGNADSLAETKHGEVNKLNSRVVGRRGSINEINDVHLGILPSAFSCSSF